MIPAIGFLIWAYAVARLIQVPIEFTGESKGRRIWLIVVSAVGIMLATIAFADLELGAIQNQHAMNSIPSP